MAEETRDLLARIGLLAIEQADLRAAVRAWLAAEDRHAAILERRGGVLPPEGYEERTLRAVGVARDAVKALMEGEA